MTDRQMAWVGGIVIAALLALIGFAAFSPERPEIEAHTHPEIEARVADMEERLAEVQPLIDRIPHLDDSHHHHLPPE